MSLLLFLHFILISRFCHFIRCAFPIWLRISSVYTDFCISIMHIFQQTKTTNAGEREIEWVMETAHTSIKFNFHTLFVMEFRFVLCFTCLWRVTMWYNVCGVHCTHNLSTFQEGWWCLFFHSPSILSFHSHTNSFICFQTVILFFFSLSLRCSGILFLFIPRWVLVRREKHSFIIREISTFVTCEVVIHVAFSTTVYICRSLWYSVLHLLLSVTISILPSMNFEPAADWLA